MTLSSLQAVIDHAKQSAWPADLVTMTGDASQDESAESYRRFRECFGALGLPVYSVPGNHDARPTMQEMLSNAPFHYCDEVEIGNWMIVGIDSCVSGEAGGSVAAEEMHRLAALLSSTSCDHVLVCLHHPPLPVGSRWLDQVGLADGQGFLDALSQFGRVRATIFGHVHQAFDGRYKEIRVIGTPSTCRQFLPESDAFGLDEKPPAYRRLSLRADGDIDSQLVWLEAE